jgi:hypothetical protein
MSPTEIMAERESILTLLPQTTPTNITKDFKNMSIIPSSRYPNIPKHLYSSMQVGHLYDSDTPGNVDLPRYHLPGFQEVVTRAQLQRPDGQLAVSSRIQRTDSTESRVAAQTSDTNANDFYQAMRDKRKSEQVVTAPEERRRAGAVLEAYEAGTRRGAPAPTSSTEGSSYQNAPGATLKEKIALKRAALEKERQDLEQEEQKGDQKTILNDIASKAEFVRKMSKTFG